MRFIKKKKFNFLSMANKYDLIVVGAGPAGLTAGLYAARYKINLLIIGDPFDSSICGAHLLENWPGAEKISGLELIQKMVNQVKSYGVEIINQSVVDLNKKENFVLKTKEKQEFLAESIIIATGTERKKINIPGEKELLGRGVSYCATCDAPFFKNKKVAIVGGGNAAIMAADLSANYADQVYLIVRDKILVGETVWQEKIEHNSKIKIIYQNSLIQIKGQDKLEEIVLNQEIDEQKELKVQGLIIEIGSEPISGWLKEIDVETNEQGYVKIKKDGATTCPGVFAAGDITDGSNNFRQVVTASAEGAIAALGVYNYLKARE